MAEFLTPSQLVETAENCTSKYLIKLKLYYYLYIPVIVCSLFFSGADACGVALQFCKRSVFPTWAGVTYFNNNNNNNNIVMRYEEELTLLVWRLW